MSEAVALFFRRSEMGTRVNVCTKRIDFLLDNLLFNFKIYFYPQNIQTI